MCSRWFSVLLMVQFDVFKMPPRMADIVLKWKIDPNLVGFGFGLSLYVDSMSFNCCFCDFS